MNLENIIKSITVKADNEYLKTLLVKFIENSQSSGSSMPFSEVVDRNSEEVGNINASDYNDFLKSIYATVKSRGVSPLEVAKNIKSNVGFYSFTSGDIEGGTAQDNDCCIFLVDPSVEMMMTILKEIRLNLIGANIPYHLEMPNIYELNRYPKDKIKVYTTTTYFEQTFNILNNIVNNHMDDIKECSILSAKITDKIGYSSYDSEKNISQKQILSTSFMKGINNALIALMQANPTFEINVNGINTKAADISIDDNNRNAIILEFYNQMHDSFLNFVVEHVKIQLDKDGIDLENIYMNDLVKLSLDIKGIGVEQPELKDLEQDLQNFSVNRSQYSNILSDEQLDLSITLKDGTETTIFNLFEKFNILESIPLDAEVTLNDGTVMKGQEFWKNYGMLLSRCDSMDEFLLAYTNNVKKNVTQKYEYAQKRRFLPNFLKKR